MFDIGFAELLVLVIIGMVVIGPEKLPGVMRTVGKTVGQARRFMTGIQNQIEQEVKLDELNKKIMAETKDMQDVVDKAVDLSGKPTETINDINTSLNDRKDDNPAPVSNESELPEPPAAKSPDQQNQ